jgi:hypothetical protein
MMPVVFPGEKGVLYRAYFIEMIKSESQDSCLWKRNIIHSKFCIRAGAFYEFPDVIDFTTA